MFTIYAGDDLVYSSGYQEPRTSVLAPKCTVEIGKASTLSFILLPTHYLYESLFRLKTDIKAFLGETQIFNGRVLSLERDFFNQKTILCEGDLAFLLDSLQPPRVITTTPQQLFTSMIAEHNIQVNSNRQFTVGIIDIPLADSSEEFEDTSYRETKAAMETDLLGRFGGYFRTRVVNGTIYLDWLKLQNDVCNQTLQFGTNILDISEQVFASDIYTVLLPTGPAPTPEDGDTEPDNTPKFPMTIESVNDGSKLLENLDGIALYGRIVKTENIQNAANPQDLKDKAEALFARTYKEQASTFSIKAIDLSLMGYDLDQFKVGHRTRILSPPHQIDTVLTVTKIQYDIAKFEDSEVHLGIFSDELPSDLWNATLKGGSMSSSMGKVAGGGGGSGGGGALGKALKYYTELEDYAKIEAKKIELIGEEVNLRVVKKGEVITAINMSEEGIQIIAEKLSITGILEALEARLESLVAGTSSFDDMHSSYINVGYAFIDGLSIEGNTLSIDGSSIEKTSATVVTGVTLNKEYTTINGIEVLKRTSSLTTQTSTIQYLSW